MYVHTLYKRRAAHTRRTISQLLHLLTIQKLIDEHKVVLYTLLGDGGEVGLENVDHFVEKLKDERRIDVLSRGRHDPDIVSTSVKVAGPCNVGDRRTNAVSCVDHIYTKCIYTRPSVDIHVCTHRKKKNIQL